MSQIDPKAQIAVLNQAIEMLKKPDSWTTSTSIPYVMGLLEGMRMMLQIQMTAQERFTIPETPTIIE